MSLFTPAIRIAQYLFWKTAATPATSPATRLEHFNEVESRWREAVVEVATHVNQSKAVEEKTIGTFFAFCEATQEIFALLEQDQTQKKGIYLAQGFAEAKRKMVGDIQIVRTLKNPAGFEALGTMLSNQEFRDNGRTFQYMMESIVSRGWRDKSWQNEHRTHIENMVEGLHHAYGIWHAGRYIAAKAVPV